MYREFKMPEVLSFLNAMPWFAWVGIVAIVCGCVTNVIAMSHKHTERMAMIQAGRDPYAKAAVEEEV
jgi:hypothetical protein